MAVYTVRRPQCAAKMQGSEERCKNVAVEGRSVCRMHGGATPAAGPNHPNYKHGLYSKALPERLADIAEQSANDPQILELNRAIGVIDARLVNLMENLSRGGLVGEAWETMLGIFEALQEILYDDTRTTYEEDEDRDLVVRLLHQADAVLDEQVRDSKTWDKIFEGIETRRKLVDTESKRRKDTQTMLSSDQAFAIIHQIVLAVRRYVTDPEILGLISRDMQQIVSKTVGGQREIEQIPAQPVPTSMTSAIQAGVAAGEMDPNPPQEIAVAYRTED